MNEESRPARRLPDHNSTVADLSDRCGQPAWEQLALELDAEPDDWDTWFNSLPASPPDQRRAA